MAVKLPATNPALAAGTGGQQTDEQVRSEIQQVLTTLEAALARGDSAEDTARMLYAEDVLISSPDTPVVRGIEGATAAVQDFFDALGPGGGKGCKYRVIDPVVASSATFASFLSLSCKANPPVLAEDLDLRLVYVWKKLPQGWRVVLETVQYGTF